MDSQKVKKIYQKKFEKHGVDPKSLFWARKGAAHQRFRQIWAEVDFNGKSVLDVGCGFGEMAKFLDKRYKIKSYTGVDIVPEFIAEAKKNFPHHKFIACDYFSKPLSEKFDVVMASGTLNSNIEDGMSANGAGNMDFRKKAIKAMFEHANIVCSFNMLGGHPQPENRDDNHVWYADSLEILEYCMSLTRRVILRHHYNPKDFTIFMYPVKS
ncbi:MAG: Methyltransferase family protein [Candidatus Woesebacteria bacterium GW2011_GWB1_43_14]|uniref:Methyltransferase family protein n=1 Tax=Candidatus Woesebacteria bacterium GW2011_GWB1_43_14 TaxID=1618578 RepID=A0A0G1DGT9_9BACT|nr:MAG: Methyltransferase family protein [Candidatus Woesebacteria bacterium GW2011_GWC1_42_9]KKS96909.1 MAG: Methyltransferase family protein [Candidatus Woesebacteria bacterium GW2011_GWB1_43_14]